MMKSRVTFHLCQILVTGNDWQVPSYKGMSHGGSLYTSARCIFVANGTRQRLGSVLARFGWAPGITLRPHWANWRETRDIWGRAESSQLRPPTPNM